MMDCLGIVAIVGVVIVLVILISSKLMDKEHLTENDVSHIARQAVRWYVASIQDKNPIVRGLHADYAVAYGDILKQLEKPDEIKRVTGLNIYAFMKAATEVQDDYFREIIQTCPDLIPPKDLKKLQKIRS